jgi:hypothetical protein
VRITPIAGPAQLCTLAEVIENYCRENNIPGSDKRRALVAQRIGDLLKTGMHQVEDLELVLRNIRP